MVTPTFAAKLCQKTVDLSVNQLEIIKKFVNRIDMVGKLRTPQRKTLGALKVHPLIFRFYGTQASLVSRIACMLECVARAVTKALIGGWIFIYSCFAR